MADSTTVRPESPTTSREPTFDDTPDVSELEITAKSGGATPTVPATTASGESEKPKKADGAAPTGIDAIPAHLLKGLATRQEKDAFVSLYEAFPGVDGKVIKAVLRAANFKPERAFEPLLEYSDPDYLVEEPTPPQPPPRPSQRTQVESDEALARRLADEFNRESATPTSNRASTRDYERRTAPGLRNRDHHDDYDNGPSFFDEELPKLGAQIQQSFFEARGKVSEMLSGLKKKMDGEDDYPPERTGHSGSRVSYDDYGYPSDNYGVPQRDHAQAGLGLNPTSGGSGGRSSIGRSSSLYRNPNYDADPRVLNTEDLYADSFRNNATSPLGSGSGRATSPAIFASSSPQPRVSGEAGSGKKWQPITSMPSQPARDRDPFELGDSDDEDAPASRKIQIVDKETESATEKKA